MEYRLLEKTELWISPVKLTEADLGACALAVARALGLNPDEIMVTDALEDRLTLDILVPTVRAEQIVARKDHGTRGGNHGTDRGSFRGYTGVDQP